MPVRGDCGRELTGPWNGRVRGLVTQRNAFWLDRPLFVLGAQGAAPPPDEARLDALKLAVEAMDAPSHRIEYWGGVTYHFGLTALSHLASDLCTTRPPAELALEQPDDAYDWYQMDGVISDCAQIVMRGRGAAARVLRRWVRDDARLLPLGAIIGLLEEAAEEAEAVWERVTPAWPWEDADPARDAMAEWATCAHSFATILDNDTRCLEAIKGILG